MRWVASIAAAAACMTFAAQLGAQTLDWGGDVSTSLGVGVFECDSGGCPLSEYNNRNIVELHLDADLAPDAVARAGFSLHNINVPTVERARDTSEIAEVQPVSLRVEETWVEGYGVLTDRLDVRVGNQRIRWGTGDGFSPSDRLNPYDLEDPTRFDRRLPVPAANVRYHLGDFVFSAVWIPFFIPSLLADDLIDIATSEDARDDVDLDLGDNDPPDIRELKTRIILPPQSLSTMQYAARISWAAPVADFALGYYWGRDSLPQFAGELFPESFAATDEIDVIVELRYPRFQMIAAETRAPLFAGMTGWIDAALILPTRTRIFIPEERLEDLARLNIIDEPDGDVEVETQSETPYPNVMAGIDRTFADFVYVNLQILHGFLFERELGGLHHYALAAVRFPSYDSPVEVELRGGGEALPDFDGFGWLASAGVTLRHADVLKFSLRGFLQNGQDQTTFGLYSPLSEVRLTASAQF